MTCFKSQVAKVPKVAGQQGSVLIVALVILFVVTLMAMSGLKNANVQERMAANAQHSNTAFQSAESAASKVLKDVGSGIQTAMINTQFVLGNVSPEVSVDMHNKDVSAKVKIMYLGENKIPLGMSLGVDQGGPFPQRFEIQGSASVSTSGAQVAVFQGFEY
ncbi:hypothetical protein A9Q81_02170 [Gammaproteobacteria bacterium 42_54_T18]|nr:hypothetical protein A9Q81_02170 [Gammaproteobacteria bacterium 42_54_T18]